MDVEPRVRVEDAVSIAEKTFPFRDLLNLNYFQKYKRGYYRQRECGSQIPPRNYLNLLTYLTEISDYNLEHGKSFAKKLRKNPSDWLNCEAIFAEVIVYRYYVRLVYEGLIQSLELEQREADVIYERLDGSRAYLEVFSISPDRRQVTGSEEVVAQESRTHTQTAMASIRQKLLRKISKQGQFSKPRENIAVIELNDPWIAGNFSIYSSLSSGYKIWIDKYTKKITERGYDWNNSIFEDESTRFLKGIIHFDLGDYASRRFIQNPFFKSE